MKIRLLNENAIAPTRAYPSDAGLDIYLPKDVTIMPGKTEVIDTGIAVQIPDGYAGAFVVRSSVSKTGLIIQPPLIDSGYRGELHIMAVNPGLYPITSQRGSRLCSLVVFPVLTDPIEIVDELDPGDRGSNWSGSSGK